MKKAILQYMRLMKSIGVENLRVVTFKRNERGEIYVYDVAECAKWLRKNNRFRSHLERLIDQYSEECCKVIIEDDGNFNRFSIWGD